MRRSSVRRFGQRLSREPREASRIVRKNEPLESQRHRSRCRISRSLSSLNATCETRLDQQFQICARICELRCVAKFASGCHCPWLQYRPIPSQLDIAIFAFLIIAWCVSLCTMLKCCELRSVGTIGRRLGTLRATNDL